MKPDPSETAAPACPPTPPGAERRVAPRCLYQQEIGCHYTTARGYEFQWARIHDLSATGIGLWTEQPLETGQVVVLELPGDTPSLAEGVRAVVVHVKPHDGDGWALGCAFERPLNDDECAALLL